MTAVEYLFTHLFPYLDFSKTEDRIKIRQFEQNALNMEKQEIIDAYASAVMKENNSDYIGMHEQSSAEIYFAETYGSNGSETKQ